MNLDSSEFTSQSSGADDDALVERSGERVALGDATFDLQARSKSKMRVNDTIVVLVATCVVAGGVILGMRYLVQLSGDRARADDATTQSIEEFIQRTTALMDTDKPTTSDLVAGLTDDRTNAQVPIDMLKKNPFYIAVAPVDIDGTIPDPINPHDDSAERAREREQRRQQYDRLTSRMKVTSITGREGNYLALIDGKVLREGDVIDDAFKLRSIESYQVVLTPLDDHLYKITLELRRH